MNEFRVEVRLANEPYQFKFWSRRRNFMNYSKSGLNWFLVSELLSLPRHFKEKSVKNDFPGVTSRLCLLALLSSCLISCSICSLKIQ